MNRQVFLSILKQIVIDMSYQAGLQVNSFVNIHGAPNLLHDSFGASIDDYYSGQAWGRKFHGQGADPNHFHLQFPVLLAEQRESQIECLDSKDLTDTWYLLVVNKVDCENCPPNMKNGETVLANTKLMLRAILQELYSYAYYEVEKDGQSSFQWLSQGRLNYLEEDDNFSILDGPIEDTVALIPTENIKIAEWGNHKDYRGVYAQIQLQYCEPVSLPFKYDNPILNGLATTVCSSC